MKDSHDRQPDGSEWTPDSVLSRGGSCIVGPLGTFLAEPVWDKEDIIYADLLRNELDESRVRSGVLWKLKTDSYQMDFDAVGSYSRPDIL